MNELIYKQLPQEIIEKMTPYRKQARQNREQGNFEDAEEAAKAGDGVHVKAKPIDPAVIAGRRKLAEDFYRDKGFSEDSIKEHLKVSILKNPSTS